jgi:hypothetical protein
MTLNTYQGPPPKKTSNNNDLMVECTLFKTIMSESYCTNTMIIWDEVPPMVEIAIFFISLMA